MNATTAMLRKEFVEQWRTSKLLIMAASFIVLGVSGPVTTKFLPDILKSSAGQKGLIITLLHPPTADDFVLSFFNQMTQLPVLILILVAMGTVAGEREHGTHVFVLTKPVSRTQFIVAKYIAYLTVLVGVVIVTAGVAAYYTYLLADTGTLAVGPFVVLTLAMLSSMTLVLALVVLFSSLFKSAVAAGGVSFIVYELLVVLAGLLPPDVGKYWPLNFLSTAPAIISGKSAASELVIPILVGLGLAVITIVVACVVATKREI